MNLSVRAITVDDFPVIAALFGAKGACGGCWCMAWRVPSQGAYWAEHKGEPNRQAFRRLVESGKAQGCLAFDGDQAVAWCSVGPKSDFAYFARSRALPDTGSDGVWSVTCFYVTRAYQRRGVSVALLQSAVELAAQRGAHCLEGYPTLPKPNTAQPPAFVHTGLPVTFQRCGFEVVAAAGARCVMRRKLQAGGEREA